jgi:hypothetical protein
VELVIRLATGYAWLTAMMVIALAPVDTWTSWIQSSNTQAIVVLWLTAYL